MNSTNSPVTKAGDDNGTPSEASLVKLYVELTGSSESVAQDVVMHVCSREASQSRETHPEGAIADGDADADRQPSPRKLARDDEWLRPAVAVPVPS